jgi:hypothetical protein
MHHNVVRSKSLLALAGAAIALMVCGAAYAGGEHCNHGAATVAAHDHGEHGEMGEHCNLAKNVTKKATMTQDGAVVVMEGKTAEAIQHIKAHLEEHQKGTADCPDCPMGMDGVTSTVKITEKGGEITMTGSDAKTIKAVQEWANKPTPCCNGKSKTAA